MRDNSESRWAEVVFLQGDEGSEVVDRLMRFDGRVTAAGPTDETVTEAIEYLSDWDYGEYPETYSWEELRSRSGTRDYVTQAGDYVLTWNSGFGYVGLAVRVRD